MTMNPFIVLLAFCEPLTSWVAWRCIQARGHWEDRRELARYNQINP